MRAAAESVLCRVLRRYRAAHRGAAWRGGPARSICERARRDLAHIHTWRTYVHTCGFAENILFDEHDEITQSYAAIASRLPDKPISTKVGLRAIAKRYIKQRLTLSLALHGSRNVFTVPFDAFQRIGSVRLAIHNRQCVHHISD